MEENNIDRNGIFWLDITCALWAHERKDIVRYTGDIQLKFSKAKVMVAGLVLAAACVVAPQQLKAEVPAAQMDGVMGQSMEDETAYEETPNLDGLIMQGAAATYSLPTMRAATGSSYSQDFLDSSFTTAGTYTSATYYHKVDYEDYQLFNGIDVSWWQTKDKKVTSVNWEKAHDAGIDFAFVRVGSRDTADGSIYFDTAADSHIQAALDNDINIGLYIFSQALTEKEAREEANFVLKQLKKYDWDVTLPIVIDREKGSHNRLTGGKLSKTKETAVCQAFADTITKAGYQASVYASYAWIKSYIDTDSLDKCGIWIARYNNTTTSNSKSGSAYEDVLYDYDFWQYSSVSRVSGYTGNLDADFWYKDTAIKTTGLKAEAPSASGPVTLSWSKAAADVTGYRVYRYDATEDKYVYLKSTKSRSYSDEDVRSGKTYKYRVRCYWTIGGTNYYGNYSSVVSVTTPPAKVSSVNTAKKSSTYLTLSWKKVSGASGYRVYKYNTKTKAYEKVTTIASGSTTSYKVTGLASATEYQFKVRAYKKAEDGNVWGSSSVVYKESTNPPKTKNLKLSTKSSAVTLSWSKVARSSGYAVYRYDSKTKKYVRIATVKSGKTVTYKDAKLKKGSTKHYKVRAYKTYNGTKYYGAYSDIVSVKVK